VNLSSYRVQRALALPPPRTRNLAVDRDIGVPMPDGVSLLADRWYPRDAGGPLPTVLIRSPYGRRGMEGAMNARPLAERGFQVLLQSCRGTFGSGGVFAPMRCEREDGLATLEWLVKQPWAGGAVVLYGNSYLGYAQWAVADRLPPEVVAMIPHVTESALTLDFLRADAFSLETPFGWGVMVAEQEGPRAFLRQRSQVRRTQRALRALPLGQADVAATGRRSAYIQDILACDAGSPRWAGIDHRHRVAAVTVPVSSVGGWYDIFLPGQVRDFAALQAAGRAARLTIGPWTHTSPGMLRVSVAEATGFGLALARGEPPPPRAPVRLFVMGEEAWRDFGSWPPPGFPPRRLHLQPGGMLGGDPPGESAPDRYCYDPADPTPAAGGPRLAGSAGPVDNADLEGRPDVLTYTTAPLGRAADVIGEVSAEIWFRSSLRYADVFVRLCDVHPDGRSANVCDGLVSLSGADGLCCAAVRLWPTAYRFRPGHRIRVQVSSGAFPRYARNPGTGEPRATAATLRAATQEVYHDPARRSAILLPLAAPA